MSDENRKLNELLKQHEAQHARFGKSRGASVDADCMVEGEPKEEPQSSLDKDLSGLVQWTTCDGKRFVPASQTAEKITPGVYEIMHSNTIGIYFERIPVLTQGLLRFPQTNSEKVVQEIQKFWDKEAIFREYGLTHKRGIIMWGPPGCHAAGTEIRMYDGTVKKVEDVRVGDELMGPDSTARHVMVLCRGKDDMYRITPGYGPSFVVNANHVLHLHRSRKGDKHLPEILEVSVKEFIGYSQDRQHSYKLLHTSVEYGEKNLSLDPYFLGVWLGDGTTTWPSVTSDDPDVVGYLFEYAEKRGLQIRKDTKMGCTVATYYFVGKSWRNNNLLDEMRAMKLLGHKHIPDNYLSTSRQQRLQLLAGLMDTDGYYSNSNFEDYGWRGCFEITQKSEELARQILQLSFSLGFRASIKPVVKTIKSRGFKGLYFKVTMGGDFSEVPCRILRKIGGAGRARKNVLRTGIKKIEHLGQDYFYGFTLDKDNLYLDENYLIHRNSGKSCTIQLIMKDVVDRNGVVIKFTHPQLFNEGMRKFREIEPSTPVVVLMEDIDSILVNFNESEVLNILDGINQIEKAVFLACPSPDHRILRVDLSWVRADSLQPGDEIIAFDDNGPDRKYRTALVNSCPLVKRPCYRVVTSEGVVTVSEHHPFLVKIGNRPLEWRSVEQLRAGNKIASIGSPWSMDNSHDGGYLSEQYDGEGTINFSKPGSVKHGFRATWVQAIGPQVNKMKQLLCDRGFDVAAHIRTPNKSGRYGPYKTKASLSVRGGRWASLRLLGMIRPERLLHHIRLRDGWENCRLAPQYVKVVSVKSIGIAPVVALDTTTKTFIGEGLLQHNTTNYPENLGARIINRPSRFDKRFFIGHPDEESRKLYFRHIIGDDKIKTLNIDLEKWVKDTEEFSIAHLKELFTAVVILGDEYDEAVVILREMKEEHISSDNDERRKSMGFANKLYKSVKRFNDD